MAKKKIPDYDNATRIIRQAAALLERDGKSCETPGCRYQIRIGDGILAVVVRVPEEANPGKALAAAPYYAKYWEDELHDMMAIAVKKIMKEANSALDVRGLL